MDASTGTHGDKINESIDSDASRCVYTAIHWVRSSLQWAVSRLNNHVDEKYHGWATVVICLHSTDGERKIWNDARPISQNQLQSLLQIQPVNFTTKNTGPFEISKGWKRYTARFSEMVLSVSAVQISHAQIVGSFQQLKNAPLLPKLQVFHVYPRFHTTFVVWNLGLTWKTLTLAYIYGGIFLMVSSPRSWWKGPQIYSSTTSCGLSHIISYITITCKILNGIQQPTTSAFIHTGACGMNEKNSMWRDMIFFIFVIM